MADNLSKEKRSWNMSRIRGQDTKPELLVRSLLYSLGFRFRLNKENLPGKPDIILPKYKIAIFVNGCFWHQHHNCARASLPKSNQSYWIPKLKNNVRRDKKNYRLLKNEGWRTLVIWECEINEGLVIKLNKKIKKHND